MPPRRRKPEQVDVEDPSYDGVPTVRVVVDAEPTPEPEPEVELPVVEVAVDETPADDDGQE